MISYSLNSKPSADRSPRHVHFTPESGHQSDIVPCPLCTMSGRHDQKDRNPVWVISAIKIIPSPDKSLQRILAIDARAQSSFPRRKGAFAEETPPGCVRRTPVIWRGVAS